MRVLVACEESQIVCKAFRNKGHEAFSNDIQECSGGHPEWHLQMDSFEAVAWMMERGGIDLLIGFPPCTYTSSVQLFRMKNNPERQEKKRLGIEFFKKLWALPIAKMALENPTGAINTEVMKAKQIIHPWYFGDNEMKRTCLWLRGLSRLNGLHEVAMNRDKFKPKPRRSFVNGKGQIKNVYFANDTKDIGNGKARSKFWPSIAKAMADQWG